MIIRIDGETSLGGNFDSWKAQEGILLEQSAPYTKSQNGGGSNFALRNAHLNLTCTLSSVISATCTCEIVSLTAGRKTWYCGRDAVILEGLKSLRLSDGRERKYLDILMASKVVGKTVELEVRVRETRV